MTATFDGTHGRRLGTTVSLEVTSTSNAVSPRTHTPRGVSPGAQTARPDPDLAIVGDISTFSALVQIIVDECSGDRFPHNVQPDDAAVPITRLAVLADVVRRLLRR